MIAPAFIFTVFMLTLGPVKTVPGSLSMTQDRTPSHVRALALKGTAVATAVSLLIALVMTGVAAPWRISPDDVRLAGGILLFLASRDVIGQFKRPAPPPLSAIPPKPGSVDPPALECVRPVEPVGEGQGARLR
jgi:multiple antibiotic resistance protein